ncbi:tRNA (cytosine-5-)-methyltransferase ncl1 [Lithohypha guttulata]|uniref:tRNA (Cytosine-5-)-methyltransferase ncl1 n=1 Tax=Lithohypha guttulata TaxID=1690604 RepID=A0AAN7T3G3_9EURO|nr:tRNA (cytosine-5-)-methyltransferase ncl1 [Lithohypha guttulata]KAK5106506.1 tRNA (cytosine-5-)-methyltransferase ncl1 [Lithohypha guttulata]
MGRGGKRGGRGRGRGSYGGPNRRDQPDNRVDKSKLPRVNEKFENFYNELGIVPAEERDAFWKAMKTDLPNSFRFTGSKAHALAVQERLRNHYIPEITSIQHEGRYVEAPQPVDWYPDKLAWFMTTPKTVVRRFPPFANFQKFLVAETDVGNITRQEVVSMIPPLVMDLKPGMTVLDLCAAPGSKSAQLLELINAGEEDRARQVAHNTANGLDRPEGIEFADDGRSTGLLIANDVDYKRAHMLVHQMKRLSSPNIIVTNHDATIYPSIKLSATKTADGKLVHNRYLKFDRILADVPCSGDGTLRKNLEIWRLWNPGNGLGLYATQVRILIRALQMLKVGGRVVYSTCSMNPVEDEAVLQTAITHCGGSDFVQLMETKDLLPGLKRYPGLRSWKIMDKQGRVWDDWSSVQKQQTEYGTEGLSRLQETMFPMDNNIPLERAMRVYPHSQNTGAFFIAILEKRSEIKVSTAKSDAIVAPKSQAQSPKDSLNVIDSNGTTNVLKTEGDGEIAEIVESTNGTSTEDIAAKTQPEPDMTMKEGMEIDSQLAAQTQSEVPTNGDSTNTAASSVDQDSSTKRKRTEHETTPQSEHKRVKSEDFRRQEPPNLKKNKGQVFEEPFKYVDESIPELQSVKQFYDLSPRFPMDRFMVRNVEGTATKNMYYTTALAKEVLQENEGKGMKFVHSGVKMFVKQDAPSPDTCPWRIQTDGLRILETWVGRKRKVKLQRKETLKKLLVEMFPRFQDDDWASLGELGDQMRDLGMGCCVLEVEPSEEEGGFSERMVFPLWKSIHSLNLMMPKEDRKAMLLRLFNDDTPLQNMNQLKKDHTSGRSKPAKQEEVEPGDAEGDIMVKTRNTSSPEPLPEHLDKHRLSDDSDAEGGVKIEEG